LGIRDSKDHGTAFDLAGPCDRRVLKPGQFLVRGQFIFIRFNALEIQRVCGKHIRVHFLEGARVDQQLDALAGGQRQVITALGTDILVGLDFFGIGRLFAIRAFHPDAVRNDLFLETLTNVLLLLPNRLMTASRL
jgi:hypothetical protein